MREWKFSSRTATGHASLNIVCKWQLLETVASNRSILAHSEFRATMLATTKRTILPIEAKWTQPLKVPLPPWIESKQKPLRASPKPRQPLKTKCKSLEDSEESNGVEYADYLTASIDAVHHDETQHKWVYDVDIRLGQQHWQVHRSYADFRRLKRRLMRTLVRPHSNDTSSTCKLCSMVMESLQNHPFSRRLMFRKRSAATVARSRQQNLNVFLGKL